MAPNKLTKPHRPTPRRVQTSPISPPRQVMGTAPASDLQRSKTFSNRDRPHADSLRRQMSDSPYSMSTSPRRNTYISGHMRGSNRPSQRIETRVDEGGWQVVDIVQVKPQPTRVGRVYAPRDGPNPAAGPSYMRAEGNFGQTKVRGAATARPTRNAPEVPAQSRLGHQFHNMTEAARKSSQSHDGEDGAD